MKRCAFLIFAAMFFLSAESSNLNLSLTDNIYRTSSKEYDIELDAEFQGKVNRERFDLFYNLGLFTPIMNNYMMNLPSDVTFQFVPVDNADRTLMTGVYSFETFYLFQEYLENNMIAPGIFIDHKEYPNDYLMIKNSIDGRTEKFIFLNEFSNSKIEASTKWMVGLPIKMSIHLTGFGGYKLNSDNSSVMRWGVTPLLSLNLFNSLGLSASFLYSAVAGETLDYYLDDSFLDEYYYSEKDIRGKATILFGEKAKGIVSGSYSVRDYLPLYHTADADSTVLGTTENRTDSIFELEVILKLKNDDFEPYFRYVFTGRNSTNALYSYNSNSLTFGIEF
ncbi:MAG: hypothetical protein AB7T10_07055 [bacterium]